MDELVKLRLQEQMLLQELELVRNRIKYVDLCEKIEQQKVPEVPCQEIDQTKASPEQTAPGKDSTNPLKADTLLKSMTEVQTSKTLVKPSDLSLRPNGGIQIPSKTKEQSLVIPQGIKGIQNPKNFYVVYNGPNAGIYNSWDVAEPATKGISGIRHRKFGSFQEARVSANLFTEAELKPPLALICKSDTLRPTYQQVLKTTSKPFKSLGKIKTTTKPREDFEDQPSTDTTFTSFDYLYKWGRKATEELFVQEKFFTTDKANISYYNFYPNSDPDLVFETYVNGLVNLIYPSNTLLEISRFPKGFKDAVKKFRTKCVKNPDKAIFIKVQSSVPFWEKDYDDVLVRPFYYVQLGIVKEKIYSPSKESPATLGKEDLQELALQKYANICEKVFSIDEDDNIKINWITANLLMTSLTHGKTSEEDKASLHRLQIKMAKGRDLGFHYPALCKKIKRIAERIGIDNQYLCQLCCLPDKGKAKADEDSPPNTSGTASTSSPKSQQMADNGDPTTTTEKK